MEISPENRQDAKDALAYLTSLINQRPGDTTTPADILKSLAADGLTMENLLAGMTTLVSMLVAIRARDDQIPGHETFRQLGAYLTEGE
ncbi:hypothetical protein [Mycolicibacterium mengxianglii]|uniref:hypothetical protein n=1 Tax=Mycolicibacterium mengxianglii TaxID=2736649 RepID=UPI0018EF1ED5|nr:hypothetical protein [Mycolicibacterium mengxianglii]